MTLIGSVGIEKISDTTDHKRQQMSLQKNAGNFIFIEIHKDKQFSVLLLEGEKSNLQQPAWLTYTILYCAIFFCLVY